jgi:predicted  nucleic acid-binding Zn-ribbon protein
MTKEEIERDLAPDRYINPFRAKMYIQFLLTSLTEMEERVKELEQIISNGVLKDHDGCQIYHDEEYTKLESKFYEAESRLKKLEEAVDRHRDIIGESASETDKQLYKVRNEIGKEAT